MDVGSLRHLVLPRAVDDLKQSGIGGDHPCVRHPRQPFRQAWLAHEDVAESPSRHVVAALKIKADRCRQLHVVTLRSKSQRFIEQWDRLVHPLRPDRADKAAVGELRPP
jgi:hypothetical protein